MKPAVIEWNPQGYGALIADILALAENRKRLMPLAEGACCSPGALRRIRDSQVDELFPEARAPQAALAGLYLYFSCRDEAHEVAQADPSAEGSYWHGIVHRQPGSELERAAREIQRAEWQRLFDYCARRSSC
jgi:hypothetical protein